MSEDSTITLPDTKRRLKEDEQQERKKQPPYHVIVLNDEEHTYEYVIEMLGKVCGHSRATGMEMARTIDSTGRAIVLTTHKELAELKRDQVLAYGPDPRMSISKGPMGCYIEPAPTD